MPKFKPPSKPADLARTLLERRLVGSTGYASELAHGVRTPSYELALKLEDELGIPPRYWQALKRARIDGVAA